MTRMTVDERHATATAAYRAARAERKHAEMARDDAEQAERKAYAMRIEAAFLMALAVTCVAAAVALVTLA